MGFVNEGQKVKVRCMYRPENTQASKEDVAKMDFNLLFWTDDFHTIRPSDIEGKCFILPITKIEPDLPFRWASRGNFRYFFSILVI